MLMNGIHRRSRGMPMPSTLRAPAVNRLLEALPTTDLRRVLARCETVELVFADVL